MYYVSYDDDKKVADMKYVIKSKKMKKEDEETEKDTVSDDGKV